MKWRGTGMIGDERSIIFPAEDIGYLTPVDRSATVSVGGTITLEADATYEQLPYIFAAGITNLITGAADGSGSGKIYAYAFPSTAANSIQTFTIEAGDDQQEEEMEYCFTESFSLTAAYGEPVKVSAVMRGRQVTASTFTASLTPVAVDTIIATKSSLYIDVISGTVGSTAKTNALVGWDLNVVTGWKAAPVGDGNLYFAFAKSTAPEIRATVTFEHDATAVAEKAAWRAETARLMRIKVAGPALTTNGTTYSTKTLLIDLPGKWETFGTIDERDGNDIVQGTFVSTINIANSKIPALTVVNETATLP
jgi:hypothetical protein